VRLAGVFVVVYSVLPSTNIVSQILVSVPIAFVGGVIAVLLSGNRFPSQRWWDSSHSVASPREMACC